MIILNPRLKICGKRYGSTNITFSQAYSTDNRIAILVDGLDRLLTFNGSLAELKNDFNSVHKNNSHQFRNYFIKKSLTRFKIIFPDCTTLVGSISEII